MVIQQPTIQYNPNFTKSLNSQFNNLQIGSGIGYGFDATIGYFLSKDHSYGIGTGIKTLFISSNATLDNFHVEYQNTDSKNEVFRQVVSSSQPIREILKISTANIPLSFLWKKRMKNDIYLSFDGGLLINLKYNVDYNSNASFDYEAIYAYQKSKDGKIIGHIYDNNPIPMEGDWLITKAQIMGHPTTGNILQAFDSLRSRGFNVGLALKPSNSSGSLSLPTNSIGLYVHPQINFHMKKRYYFTISAYISYQAIKNNVGNGYQLVTSDGNYSSLVNTLSGIANFSYGITGGMKIFLGHSSIYYGGEHDVQISEEQ